jgi:mannose-6-phosphate isomerase
MSRTDASDILREPLRFERICLEKVWGGRRLERTPGIPLPGLQPIGETWELVDRDDPCSVVASGNLKGRQLRDLVREHGDALLGRTRRTPEGRFPLLIKFLDASEPLSVQVHPPSGTRGPLGEGKSEAWYFLDTQADSRIWLGLRDGVTRDHLAKSAPKRAVLDHVREYPARKGEAVFVPGGTVHALGAGITLLEVQENADTTHRFYDWDRMGLDGKPRDLQVEKAVASTVCGGDEARPRAATLETAAAGVKRANLVDSSIFAMDLFEIEGSMSFDTQSLALVHVVVAGRGKFVAQVEPKNSVDMAPGDTWLVPASLGRHTISSAGGPLRIIRVTTRA